MGPALRGHRFRRGVGPGRNVRVPILTVLEAACVAQVSMEGREKGGQGTIPQAHLPGDLKNGYSITVWGW